MTSLIAANLFKLTQQIRECEKRFNRTAHSVSLLAVTKGQSLEKITCALEAGQHAFGESYLQEALPKIEHYASLPLEWHFIGPLQRNKTKKIAEHFHWVQSIDQLILAERLNAQRPPGLPPLNICLQVNISNEATKSGVASDQLLMLAEKVVTLPRLTLRGLMAIPAPKQHFSEQREELNKLTQLYDMLRNRGFMLDTLSMGMSEDWEAAIAEGATMIRIGTSIFGERD